MESSSLITRDDINVVVTYFDGPKVTIESDTTLDFIISFYDNDELIDEVTIQSNMYYEHNRKYHTDWIIKVKIKDTDELIHVDKYELDGKRVLFEYGSDSIGDILAWMPYIEEFTKKHNCISFVYCSEVTRPLFDKNHYKDITFISGSYTNIYKRYQMMISWRESKELDGVDVFRTDYTRNPINPFFIPEQKIGSDILGLDYEEKKPVLSFKTTKRNHKVFGKYVCISIQSTSQAKYWNWIGGWDEVVSYIKSELKLSVICIDAENNWGNRQVFNETPRGAIDDTGYKPLKERASMIYNSEFFIGLGSGMSWLAWSIGKPVIMISSFSKPYTEFDCHRLYNDNPFSGYYNTGTYDRRNWNWNPIIKCNTKEDWHKMETITPRQVIQKVKSVWEGKNVKFI